MPQMVFGAEQSKLSRRTTLIWLGVTQLMVVLILAVIIPWFLSDDLQTLSFLVLVATLGGATYAWLSYFRREYETAIAITSWLVNTLLLAAVLLIWWVMVANVMTYDMDDMESDILPPLDFVTCGVPVATVIYLLCSLKARTLIYRHNFRVSFLLIAVSWGVILLPLLPWLVYSALYPGTRFGIF